MSSSNLVMFGAVLGGVIGQMTTKQPGKYAVMGAVGGVLWDFTFNYVLKNPRAAMTRGAYVTGAGDGGLSFEDAWARAEQQATIGQASGPDPIEKIRVELSNASAAIVSACAPETTSVVIKAAIQNGRAVGVSVYATPPSPAVSACVASRVRRLSFSASGHMDAVTASF